MGDIFVFFTKKYLDDNIIVMIGRTPALKVACQQFIRKWKPIGIHFSNEKHIKLCKNYNYKKQHSSGPGIYAIDLDNETSS